VGRSSGLPLGLMKGWEILTLTPRLRPTLSPLPLPTPHPLFLLLYHWSAPRLPSPLAVRALVASAFLGRAHGGSG